MFTTPTLVSFAGDETNNRTVMEIVAGDRPGLLCQVGQVLRDHRVAIQAAKILTVGERAEDVFYVTDMAGAPLMPELCDRLKVAVTEALNSTA
jgi:[protein-PII] uridylyltransferase